MIQTGALSKNLLHVRELKGVRGRNSLALDGNVQHQRLHLKFQGKGNYQPWTAFKSFSNSQPGHAQPHQTMPGSVCSVFSDLDCATCREPGSCIAKHTAFSDYFVQFICFFYLLEMVITFLYPTHSNSHRYEFGKYCIK